MVSRIRRATLRMTLESSTIRHDFITRSLLHRRRFYRPMCYSVVKHHAVRFGRFDKIFEPDHERAPYGIKAYHAGRQMCPYALHTGRRRPDLIGVEADDLINRDRKSTRLNSSH